MNFIFNNYAKKEEDKPTPKAFKYVDPLVFIHQFLQHVLPRSKKQRGLQKENG